MNWSPETSELRDRYLVLYGVTQGMGATVGVIGLGWGCFGFSIPVCLLLAWGLSLVVAWVWRWSWRVYRRAYRAELDSVAR